MSKINKNSIIALFVSAFVLSFLAVSPAFAETITVNYGANATPNNYYNYSYQTNPINPSLPVTVGYGANSTPNVAYANNTNTNNNIVNPVPVINSINPNKTGKDSSMTIITIKGNNFIPSSIARWNSENRPTTFVNSNELKMQINSEDVKTLGDYLVTVFNGAPGGGFSNSVLFVVNNDPASTEQNNLAANALFGANGFMPSTFLGWLMLGILVLALIFLFRKLYVSDKERKETHLKHA